MDLLWQGLKQAAILLLPHHASSEVWTITWLTLKVTAAATFVSLLIGIPSGTWLALTSFRGRNFAIALVNTGMGLPPVVVGLFVCIALWRSGPLGFTHLIYTPSAIVLAQLIIATPIITGLTVSAMQQIDPKLRLQLLGLGASRAQLLWSLWREAKLPLLAAVMAGYGGVISEVGASMMVGGNIKGQTRVLTTAMVLETSKGNFAMAIALGILLLMLAFAVNWSLTHLQQLRRPG